MSAITPLTTRHTLTVTVATVSIISKNKLPSPSKKGLNRSPRADDKLSITGMIAEIPCPIELKRWLMLFASPLGTRSSKMCDNPFVFTFLRAVSKASRILLIAPFMLLKSGSPILPSIRLALSLMVLSIPEKELDILAIMFGNPSFMPSVSAFIAASALMPWFPMSDNWSAARPKFLAKISLTGIPSWDNCMTSCPMSFPVVLICPITKAICFNPSAPLPSPAEAFPTAVKVGIISRASKPNAFNCCAAGAISSNSKGVSSANSRNWSIITFASWAEPSIDVNAMSVCSILAL